MAMAPASTSPASSRTVGAGLCMTATASLPNRRRPKTIRRRRGKTPTGCRASWRTWWRRGPSIWQLWKPSRAIRPGVLVAGTNCVATDAVCMAVMGYDPLAVRGAPPFEKCDSTLQLAEELGVGPRDLRRIEMVGTPLREALFRYRV